MNDSPRPKLTLEDIRKMTVKEAMELDLEILQELQKQADKAVFAAGLMLDWIRGIIVRKTAQQPGGGKTDA